MSDTAAAYDLLAERWLDAAFDPLNGLAQHERALAFLNQAVGGWALNAGCGCNTRFNAAMRLHGLQLEGIDLSARMLALAAEADPDIVLHQADLCDWQPARTYRFISAWDSIWHVGLNQQRPLMEKLLGALDDGGVMIFSAGGLDAPGEHVDASMGPPLRYSTLGIPGLLALLAAAGCALRHLEFDQYPQKHVYLIVQRLPL
ncbi:class I SAM-dependent methyltransferase [Massilia sp. IC2-477]|uniref:class I SAM-dependent DNA methyltransferase n=1 Tax=Massilia sp. IC2-477 TaxID=2887198 RepID=UPI001D11D7B4|nr:class I SAM-dependent methyltransferase [Massilia sp. IC2-477]MCC2958571.1 class I SAM-dependent methyltransferase [Massilia sp. IC2-477]